MIKTVTETVTKDIYCCDICEKPADETSFVCGIRFPYTKQEPSTLYNGFKTNLEKGRPIICLPCARSLREQFNTICSTKEQDK